MKNPPNEYILRNGYYELHIFSIKHGEFVALIDVESYDKIKNIHWGVEFDGYNWYVRNRSKNLKLHRFLTDCPNDKIIDHINRNTLDNRLSNLRVCTFSENNANRPLTVKYPHSTTEYGIGIWHIKNKSGKQYCYYKVQIYGYKSRVFKSLNQAILYRNEILKTKEKQ